MSIGINYFKRDAISKSSCFYGILGGPQKLFCNYVEMAPGKDSKY
jgi:hypothetical protein